uniref:Histone-lysine N-methyltransferase SETMAR n=1 Tax=Romanomermis culicivorax TaxID=13658 RepID=A0A915KBL7_ROMCU
MASLAFTYVTTNVIGPGTSEEQFEEILYGCDCSKECSTESGCSCLSFGQNYDSIGRLVALIDKSANAVPSVIECGKSCSCKKACSVKCTNRVAQNGINVPLEVFATSDARGYGLKTLHPLIKGQFVCEYAGEIISYEAAESLLRNLDADLSKSNYIFNLKEILHNGEKIQTLVDATRKANLGRFINHSCQPNLCVVPVRYDFIVPHLGLFCTRDVQAGEELCYDY